MKDFFNVIEDLLNKFASIKLYKVYKEDDSWDINISKNCFIKVNDKNIFVYYVIKECKTIFGTTKLKYLKIIQYYKNYYSGPLVDYLIQNINILKSFIIDLKIFLEEKEKVEKELLDYLKAYDSLKLKKKNRKKVKK